MRIPCRSKSWGYSWRGRTGPPSVFRDDPFHRAHEFAKVAFQPVGGLTKPLEKQMETFRLQGESIDVTENEPL